MRHRRAFRCKSSLVPRCGLSATIAHAKYQLLQKDVFAPMKKVLILLFVATVFFPWFIMLEHSHQTYLWTYDNHRRGGAVSYDWQFRIGGETDSTKWLRTRLGFPIQPITIDVGGTSGIVQARIEPVNFLLNLIPASLLAIILLTVRWIWRGPRNMLSANVQLSPNSTRATAGDSLS